MILLALGALSAYLSWLLRNAGEDPPTFIGDIRWRYETLFPRWSRWLDCLFCAAPYAVVPVSLAAVPLDLIRWEEAPLVLGFAVVIGVIMESFLTVASFFDRLSIEAEEMDTDDAVEGGMGPLIPPADVVVVLGGDDEAGLPTIGLTEDSDLFYVFDPETQEWHPSTGDDTDTTKW